jgi:hypothetical protein
MTVRAVFVSQSDFERAHPGLSWKRLGLEAQTFSHHGLQIPVLGTLYDDEDCDFGYLEEGFRFIEDPEIFLPAPFTDYLNRHYRVGQPILLSDLLATLETSADNETAEEPSLPAYTNSEEAREFYRYWRAYKWVESHALELSLW